MMSTKLIFITGTDTGVGKTVATAVLAMHLRRQGFSVGVIKPVQCAGNDAAWLKKILDLPQALSTINPIYVPEPLSPHLALKRAHQKFDIKKINKSIATLKATCDVILIEGAGGLMVPLTPTYYNADLIKDLKAETIIVSRLGLGTINHTLLTINQAKAHGVKIKGILFSTLSPKAKTLPEQTNPSEIQQLSGINVLGIIPYLKSLTKANISKQCQNLKLNV